jgi:hypothetical protein
MALPPRSYNIFAVDQSYPGATQLALDMLLKVDAHEELIMVLLQRKQIIPALKYVRERNIIAPAASFLKAAKATGDDGAPPPPFHCHERCAALKYPHRKHSRVFCYVQVLRVFKRIKDRCIPVASRCALLLALLQCTPPYSICRRNLAPSTSNTSANCFYDKIKILKQRFFCILILLLQRIRWPIPYRSY